MQNSTYVILGVGVLILLCIPMMAVLKEVLPSMVERSANLEAVENNIYTLQAEVHEKERAVHGIVSRRNAVGGERSRLQRDSHRLHREAEQALKRMPLFVHEVGEPTPGLQKFQLKLTREVSKPTVKDAIQAVNPIWDHANVIEVWARNSDEARQLSDNAFPTKLGFIKVLAVGTRTAPRPARIRETA